MALIKKKKLTGAEIPTSSMADIAFLMLLFFLVATVIDTDFGLGIQLPEYVEEITEVKVDPNRLVRVNINDMGKVLFGYGKNPDNELEFKLIQKTIVEILTKRIDQPENKKIIVSLKTARLTKYNVYLQALDAIKSGYKQVRDARAMQLSGKKFDALDDGDPVKEQVKKEIPVVISLAEPEKVTSQTAN